MDNSKIENMLNLALDATPGERARSLNLDVGFDGEENTWELIVKYSGSLSRLEEEGIVVTELLNEYAVLIVPESGIGRLAEVPEIEYIEKPKRLFFAAEQGRTASCVTGVQNARYDLYGDGVLVAVLDSGVDYTHPDFRNEDGTTRILALWDQTIPGRPPAGYRIGTEYTKEQIERGILFFCAVFGLTALVSFAGVAMRTAAATSAVARNAFAPDLFYYKISYYAYNGEPDDNYRRNFKRTHTMPQSISFLVC